MPAWPASASSSLDLALMDLESVRRDLTTAANKNTRHNNKMCDQSSCASSSSVFPSTSTHLPLPNLATLPDCALEQVLHFLHYDNVAHIRLVSRRFNIMCQKHLNKGFRLAEKFHSKCMREVKAKLPRRESERRLHPLSRHCDILTAIETRISLLSMTFMKFVDVELCCFIPGKVIDEIFSVLRTLLNEKNPPRAYEVLQELRDISSMAMEHFDEKIAPYLKINTNGSPLKFNATASYINGLPLPAIYTSSLSISPSCSTPRNVSPTSPLFDRVSNTERRCQAMGKRIAKSNNNTRKLLREYKQTLQDQNVKIVSLESVIGNQQTLIANQSEQLKEQESRMAEISKRLEEHREMMEQVVASTGAKKRKANSEAPVRTSKRLKKA